MAWDDIARGEHRRGGLRYQSDLSDAEWVLIAALLPGPRPGGRPRTTSLRDVMEAILYIASSGCQWRMLPKDFPPVSTVQGYFYPVAGWSNAPSDGSAAAAASLKTGSEQSKAPPPGPSSPASACSHAGSQGSALLEELLNRALSDFQ